MNKRGQFYLLAAIIIIALAVGFFAMGNFSESKENPRVNELASQLDIESQKVLERGAQTGNYGWASFTKNFSDYAGDDVEIYFVVGNTSVFKKFYWNESGENEGFSSAGPHGPDYPNNILLMRIGITPSYFCFLKGENFFYTIIQEINGERYVETNSNCSP